MRERWICTVEREKLWQLFSDGGKHSAPVCSVLSPHQRYFILCEQLCARCGKCPDHMLHVVHMQPSLYYASDSAMLSALHLCDCMQRVN